MNTQTALAAETPGESVSDSLHHAAKVMMVDDESITGATDGVDGIGPERHVDFLAK